MTPDPNQPASLNPNALTVGDLVQLFAKLKAGTITAAMIEGDVKAGAPVNADGTLKLLHYCAWLVRECLGEGPHER